MIGNGSGSTLVVGVDVGVAVAMKVSISLSFIKIKAPFQVSVLSSEMADIDIVSLLLLPIASFVDSMVEHRQLDDDEQYDHLFDT